MCIKYIKIYGERNSGLIELAHNLNKNLIDVEILSGNYSKGWQHGEPLYNFKKEYYNTLFICLIRDLNEWINMMYQKPYHINNFNNFDHFISTNLENIETNKIDHDTNINEFEKNKNIFQIRYDKYKRYKDLLKFNNCILLNINQILKDQIKLYSILQKEFNINYKDKLVYLNKDLLKVNNLKIFNSPFINKNLEEEINNLSIKFSKYNYKYNEYYDILRKLILSKPELIINYKNCFPEIIYISHSKNIDNFILKKYKDKSILIFLGYNYFENTYNTNIFSQLKIKLIDFIKYIRLYYDFKPLILFNNEETEVCKYKLINEHIKSNCYLSNCCFCNKSNDNFLNILESFIENDKNLSDGNLKINNMINQNIISKTKNLLNIDVINNDIESDDFILHLINNDEKINYNFSYKYFLGIITRCKDEKYVNEFVEHYKFEGVDKIIIIDDNSKDKGIYELVKNKDFVDIYYENNIISNNIANKIYHSVRHNFKWLMFIDIDEYITTIKNKNKTIRDELIDTYHNEVCIKIPWIIMSFNNQTNYPKSILKTNIYRMNYNINHKNVSKSFKFRQRNKDIDVKCIFKTKYFSDISLKDNRSHDHYPIKDKNFYNCNLIESLTNKKCSYSPQLKNMTEIYISNAYLLCYHYRINCIEHAKDKIKNNVWYKDIDISDILNFNHLDIKDETLKNKAIERNYVL